MDRGAWQATVHGVAKSQMRLRDWKTTVQAPYKSQREDAEVTVPLARMLPGPLGGGGPPHHPPPQGPAQGAQSPSALPRRLGLGDSTSAHAQEGPGVTSPWTRSPRHQKQQESSLRNNWSSAFPGPRTFHHQNDLHLRAKLLHLSGEGMEAWRGPGMPKVPVGRGRVWSWTWDSCPIQAAPRISSSTNTWAVACWLRCKLYGKATRTELQKFSHLPGLERPGGSPLASALSAVWGLPACGETAC